MVLVKFITQNDNDVYIRQFAVLVIHTFGIDHSSLMIKGYSEPTVLKGKPTEIHDAFRSADINYHAQEARR